VPGCGATFGPTPQEPECCIERGALIDTERPTRRFCDGRLPDVRTYRARLASRRTMPVRSIITRDILPGLGPVCPECVSRGHIAALRLSPEWPRPFRDVMLEHFDRWQAGSRT